MKQIFKSNVSKILAYVLSFCMIISVFSFSGINARAAEDELSLKVDTAEKTLEAFSDQYSDTPKIDYSFYLSEFSSLKEIADAGYKTLKVVFTVSSCEGTNVGSNPYVNGTKWVSAGWIDMPSTGTYTVKFDIDSLDTTDTAKLKIGIQICNLKADSTVKMNVDSVSVSKASGTGNNTEIVNEDIDYNYAKLLNYSLYLYDANMCGSDVDENSEFSWRNDCHTGNANYTYNKNGLNKTVDLSGGYHDAGDHVIFGLPEAYSATVLGMSYYEFKDAYKAANATSHYARIMDRFAEFFEKCTITSSTTDNSLTKEGSVVDFCVQIGNGDTDHSYWGAPENQEKSQGVRPVYFASDYNNATDVVCQTSAALTLYYLNFKDDSARKTKAETALLYAKKLVEYADNNTKGCNTAGSGYYLTDNPSWKDEYSLAVALLYKATGDKTYSTKFYSDSTLAPDANWVPGWDNVGYLAYLYAPNGVYNGNQISGYLNTALNKTIDNNFAFVSDWASARHNCGLQLTGLLYDKLSDKNSYGEWSKGQMGYILGNNAGKHCFVVGYNGYSSKYAHHRAASGTTDGGAATGSNYKHVLVGALVGGPSVSSTSYVDVATDYKQNEVALDYNANLACSAAGLLSYTLASGTDEEKDAQKVVAIDTSVVELRTLEESGSDPIEDPDPVLVTSVSLDKNEIVMNIGGTYTFSATVSPKDATDDSITWNTSNSKVVTVENGKIKAISSGVVNITATAKDGSNKSDVCKVIVCQSNPYSIDISKITSTNNDYIDTLIDNNLNNTISVTHSNGKYIVELTQDHSYTITGKNENVIIKSSSSKNVTLDGAILDSVNIATNNGKVNLTGNNTVTAGIDAAGDVIILNGTQNITNKGTAIKADSVQVKDGNVTIKNTASDITSTGVVYGEKSIELLGGTVNATSTNSSTVTFVVGPNGKIVIDGCKVNKEATYNVGPVDKNGNAISGTGSGENSGEQDPKEDEQNTTEAQNPTEDQNSTEDDQNPNVEEPEKGEDSSEQNGNDKDGNQQNPEIISENDTDLMQKTFTIGNYKYKITKIAGNSIGEVSLIKVIKKTKKLSVGAKVKYNGKTYNITSIGKKACANNKKLKTLIIGKNVKKIGASAFSGCKKLSKVTIKTKKLTKKTVGKKAFAKTSKKITVKVPKSKKKLYKKILKKKGVSKKAKIK